MLTLDDINKLPRDPSEEHLIALGLLPQPQPAPSIVPPATNIPKPSAVTPSPALTPSWRAKLEATAPHTPAASPLPVAPTGLGMEPTSPISPVGADSPLAGHDFPKLAPLNFKERQALPTSSAGAPAGSKESALAELQRMEDQRANPWGSEENHPGTLGKIGHYAAKIGNIAGNIIAPATMANIEGTELNKQGKEGALKGEIAAGEKAEEAKKTGESERELRSAEAENQRAQAVREPEGKTTPELETIHDMMTGDEGKPRQNPDTGKPYTYMEAYEQLKQAGMKAANTTPANTVAPAHAIDDYQQRLNTLGLDGPSLATFKSVPAGTTMGELEKRYTDAKSLREMNTKDRENAIREQERRDAAAVHAQEFGERREERIEAKGQKWVTGEDASGKTVMVPQSQAKDLGLKNLADASADTQNRTISARHVMPLLFKNDPADPGVVQMIRELDAKGELGPLASRWQDFLTGKWGGNGDPLYKALHVRLDLANTKLMQAHVGSRGGSYMLEHFEDLANAGKLDAKTLLAGVDQELRYVNDLSMLPSKGGGGTAGGGKAGGHSFSIGDKHYENVPDDVYQRSKKKPGFKE